MEKSTEPSLPKILLSYEEFQRLKHIEQKYIELEKQVHSEQKGSGIINDSIGNYINVVYLTVYIKAKFERPINFSIKHLICDYHNLNICFLFADPIDTPNLLPQIARPQSPLLEETPTPQPFSLTISKSTDNTPYDSKELLSLIPKIYCKQAQKLLEILLSVPNEFTWNISGTIFINNVSIPNSNFFLIFPALFKRNKVSLSGIDEVLEKLAEMGLTNYIVNRKQASITKPLIESSNEVLSSINTETKVQWWYIGD